MPRGQGHWRNIQSNLVNPNLSREFQKSCPDKVFRLIDDPEFPIKCKRYNLSGLGTYIKIYIIE